MTATSPLSKSAPVFTVRCWADLDVHVEERADRTHAFDFQVRDQLAVDVDRSGEITFRAGLDPFEESRLSFTLADSLGGSWEIQGIQLGLTEKEAKQNPVVRDSGGQPYPGTFFQVSNQSRDGRLETLFLTRTRETDPQAQPPYYEYVLSVVDPAGNVRTIDPRIYNKGDGGTLPRDRESSAREPEIGKGYSRSSR